MAVANKGDLRAFLCTLLDFALRAPIWYMVDSWCVLGPDHGLHCSGKPKVRLHVVALDRIRSRTGDGIIGSCKPQRGYNSDRHTCSIYIILTISGILFHPFYSILQGPVGAASHIPVCAHV